MKLEKAADPGPGLPEGYLAHDGGECPVLPNAYVDCIIRTDEGLGHSGVGMAKLHDWTLSGIGSVAGWRPGVHGEHVDRIIRWPEHPPAHKG